MYCVMNVKTKQFLNYASKRKKMFGSGTSYHVVTSPFPTLRPKEHIELFFKKWIGNVYNPEDYEIVEWRIKTK